MRLSLVMPTLNAGPLLEEVLQGVARQPAAQELELCAVDSGSTDDTVTMLQDFGFAVHGIDKADFNHGSTRDLAIAKTSGEVVLLLTQDATPADEHWLDKLAACYADPRVGAAYCRQIPREDCNPLIKKRILEWTASRSERVIQAVEGADAAAREQALLRLPPLERLQTCAYDNVAGSVRRSSWERQPFGFRRFGEDVAFGKRLILSGQAIAYEPAAAVIHSHNRSPKAEGKRIFCDHANLRELFDVHLMPSLRDYRHSVRSGRAEFRRILAELDLPQPQRDEVAAWADRYAWWSATGIYLGGNIERLKAGGFGWLFRWIEKKLRAGI